MPGYLPFQVAQLQVAMRIDKARTNKTRPILDIIACISCSYDVCNGPILGGYQHGVGWQKLKPIKYLCSRKL